MNLPHEEPNPKNQELKKNYHTIIAIETTPTKGMQLWWHEQDIRKKKGKSIEKKISQYQHLNMVFLLFLLFSRSTY